MAIYSVLNQENGAEVIQRINDDGTVDTIPSDPANKDYAEYLATLNS